MKLALGLILLLLCVEFSAGPSVRAGTATTAVHPVVLTFTERGPAPCPRVERGPVKNEDGTYSPAQRMTTTLVACWSTATWREVWTDLPERGGKFVARLPNEKEKTK